MLFRSNRLRYPLEVFAAIRAVWPAAKPMSVRISATDWKAGGLTGEESVEVSRMFSQSGCDLIDVSTGQTVHDAEPVFGRMFQTPFSDKIRNEAHVDTIAVGAISEADHVNSIVAAGRADLCAIARPHLADPAWVLHEAAKIGVKTAPWPKQYYSGRLQYETALARAAAAPGPAK